jgi:hypothetical protein
MVHFSKIHQDHTQVVCLTFFYSEILERFLSNFLAIKDQVDIHIVENSSQYSDNILRVIEDYSEKINIVSHTIFEENITSNALHIYLNDIFEKNIIQSEYIVITDADLLCAPQWLEQSKTLFNTYQDIGSVATQINFDHEIGKNIKTAITKGIRENNYLIQRSGWVLKLIQTDKLTQFLAYIKQYNINFHDCELDVYLRHVLRLKSVLTLKPIANHLTWDYLTDEYLNIKRQFTDPWFHNKVSKAETFSALGQSFIEPNISENRIEQGWRSFQIINSLNSEIYGTLMSLVTEDLINQFTIPIGGRNQFNRITPGPLQLICTISGDQYLVNIDAKNKVFELDLTSEWLKAQQSHS